MRRMGIGLGVGINRSNYAQGIFGAYATRVVADGGITEAGQCVDAVSGILQRASLLLIPSGYKGGKLYAEIPTNGNGDLTWTRSGTANRTNASGNIELMGANVPRLSYMYGSCPAVLLEPQRTNLALQSEAFNDVTWVKSQSSITANSTTSPDGNTTADTFTGDGNLAQHFVYQNNSLTSGVVYTMSVYAKKNTNDFLQITAGSFLFGVNAFANFNLSNGTIGTVGSSSTATITSVGNGWYRCTMTATAITTSSGLSALYTLISSSTSARAETNMLSTSVFLFGAQLEAGAYPTTYIPTTSSSATRVADACYKTGISSLIGSTAGTMFIDINNPNPSQYLGTPPANTIFGSINSGDYLNNFHFTTDDANIYLYCNASGGALQAAIGTTMPTTSKIKMAVTYTSSAIKFFLNGVLIGTDTSFTLPSSMSRADIGHMGRQPDSQRMRGSVNEFLLFTTALTDAEAIALTTL